jgi:hypothetical protein
LWLIGGLIEPFKIARRERRRAAMFACFWFAFIFVGLSIPAAKQQRYILAVMPAAGLLVAMFIREHDERVQRGTIDRLFAALSAGLWIALALASVWVVAALGWRDALTSLAARWIDQPDIALTPTPRLWAIMLGIALLLICFAGWREHRRRPWLSAVLMAAWMLTLMPVIWRQEAAPASTRVRMFVEEAARVRRLIGDAPLASFRWIETTPEGWDWKINEEFRFYFGRLIPRVNRAQFDDWLKSQSDTLVIMVRANEEAAAFLKTRGFQPFDHAIVDNGDDQQLWRR